MTKTDPKRKVVEAFEAVVRERAWIGSAHPGDQLEIERDYHRMKAALLKALGLSYMPADEDDA